MTGVTHIGDRKRRFGDAERWLGPLDSDAAAALASAAGDLALLVDRDGIVRDVACGARDIALADKWVGQPWIQLVTVESRVKIEEMLAGAVGEDQRWRQVNHSAAGADIPIRYKALRLSNGGTLAIGRDERATAQLQQRLLQVQQSLERDYLRLRQAESRYRLLFDTSAEPMLIVEADTLRIREVNPAAMALIGAQVSIAGHPLVAQVTAEHRQRLVAFLGAAATGSEVAAGAFALARGGDEVALSARLFRQSGASYYLVNIRPGGESTALAEQDRLTLELVDRLPDGFVLADAKLNIVTANTAFADLVQAGATDQLKGRFLGDYVGRPAIDLDLILAQLAEHDVTRNVATILRGLDGGQEEVEISAVRAGSHYGFTIRLVARRLRDLPPAERDLPRSVEQLTELVGRMPLKDIVRESTDLIERLCIEAALSFTSNNRASAAEILGLSRQSLYSKLHRHGMARVEDDAAE
jgi:transcriptional regulator PpsR